MIPTKENLERAEVWAYINFGGKVGMWKHEDFEDVPPPAFLLTVSVLSQQFFKKE